MSTSESRKSVQRLSNSRVGVYADVPNMYRNGGQRLQYDVLREFACRDGGEAVRLNAYVVYDEARADTDAVYREGATSFHRKLRDYGYKVILKDVRPGDDEGVSRVARADTGIDLAVDALQHCERLDRVVLATGDDDFLPLVWALQSRGLRVELIGLDNTSTALREEVDFYLSGHMIPHLVPLSRSGSDRDAAWGSQGSRVRGLCYWYEAERAFGYMRFLAGIQDGLWRTDARRADSPYGTAFFREHNLPEGIDTGRLPSRRFIFEFELAASERGDGLQAVDIELVSRG